MKSGESLSAAWKSRKRHTHTAECYKTERVLTCGELELHTHEQALTEDGGCYDASAFDKETGEFIEGSLPVCGQIQLTEHTHTEECFTEVELTGEEIAALNAGAKLHIHNDSCYDEEGNLICGHEQTHIHNLDCYDEAGRLICEYGEAHVHDDSCYDEEGNLICGYRSAETYDAMKTCKGDGFTVTAMYTAEANIPEEAELIAEQITADDDEEHYAEREAQYKELMEDEDASMRALLKVGFYVDGEEIEPESTVTLTIQFLDEYGLAEGAPITVVHFADEGTEVLDGGEVENNSTTFKMDSFSEIAIGYGSEASASEDGPGAEASEGVPPYISETFDYEDDTFLIRFRIEGNAKVKEGAVRPPVQETGDAGGEGIPAEGDTEQPAPEEGEETEQPAGSEDNREEQETPQAAEQPAAGGDTGAGQDASIENADSAESSEEESADGAETPAEGDSEGAGSGEGTASAEDSVGGTPAKPRKLAFHVEPMDRASEEYAAFASYVKEHNSQSNLFLVRALTYYLTYDGMELDLSDCKVTAKIISKKTLEQYAEDYAASEASYALLDAENAGEVSLNTADDNAGADTETGTEESTNPAENPDGKSDAEQSEEAGGESVTEQTLAEDEASDTEQGEDITVPSTRPKKAAAKPAAASEEEEAEPKEGEEAKESGESGEENIAEDGVDDDTAEETQPKPADMSEVVITAVEVRTDTSMAERTNLRVNELENLVIAEDSAEAADKNTSGNTMEVILKGRNVAAYVSGTPNPHFTVQYYGKLERLVEKELGKDVKGLALIDTSGAGDGTGGKLPENGKYDASPNDNNLKEICLKTDGTVETKTTQTEIYAEREFDYIKAPSLNYFDALADKKTNYDLEAIWILKADYQHLPECKYTETVNGEERERIKCVCPEEELSKPENWIQFDKEKYGGENFSNLHFTNRQTDKNNYIRIQDNSREFQRETITPENTEFSGVSLLSGILSDSIKTHKILSVTNK